MLYHSLHFFYLGNSLITYYLLVIFVICCFIWVLWQGIIFLYHFAYMISLGESLSVSMFQRYFYLYSSPVKVTLCYWYHVMIYEVGCLSCLPFWFLLKMIKKNYNTNFLIE